MNGCILCFQIPASVFAGPSPVFTPSLVALVTPSRLLPIPLTKVCSFEQMLKFPMKQYRLYSHHAIVRTTSGHFLDQVFSATYTDCVDFVQNHGSNPANDDLRDYSVQINEQWGSVEPPKKGASLTRL